MKLSFSIGQIYSVTYVNYRRPFLQTVSIREYKGRQYRLLMDPETSTFFMRGPFGHKGSEVYGFLGEQPEAFLRTHYSQKSA